MRYSKAVFNARNSAITPELIRAAIGHAVDMTGKRPDFARMHVDQQVMLESLAVVVRKQKTVEYADRIFSLPSRTVGGVPLEVRLDVPKDVIQFFVDGEQVADIFALTVPVIP